MDEGQQLTSLEEEAFSSPADRKRLAIMGLLKEPLSNSSVTRFCSENGINRQTFYRLFDSKEDLVFWYIRRTSEVSLNLIGRGLSWHEGVAKALKLLQLKQELFGRETASMAFGPSMYGPRSMAERREVIVGTLEHHGLTLDVRLETEVSLYLEFETSALRLWTTGKSAVADAEVYAEIWEGFVPQRLHDALESGVLF